MSDQKIQPERITKPIQLLAAWLAGLLLVNTAFLTAAGAISAPSWISGALVVASIINVPLFLACLFLLQTKFRPQMQEDSYYSKYLESNTGIFLKESKLEVALGHIKAETSEANQRYIEMFSQLSREVAALANAADMRNQSGEEPISATKSRSNTLEEQLNEASRSNLSVQLNDLVPSYKQLRAELLKMKIPLGPSFGSTSVEPSVPEVLTIGFGRAVPLLSLQLVVKIAERCGFDRIHYSEGDLSADRIYVGSYIYQSPEAAQPVPIEDVRDVLEAPDASLSDVISRIIYLQARA